MAYVRSVADPQSYLHPTYGTIIVAHVDDLLIACHDSVFDGMKRDMDKEFTLKWCSELKDDEWARLCPRPPLCGLGSPRR